MSLLEFDEDEVNDEGEEGGDVQLQYTGAVC